MSYILDALKKSEQERGHGDIPDVQTVHSSSLSYRNEKRTYWPYILITAVLLNLAAIIYFITNKEEPVIAETIAPVENVSTMASNEKSEAPDISEKVELTEKSSALINGSNTNIGIKDKPAGTVATSPDLKNQHADKKETIATTTDSPPASNNINIVEYYELPESIKQDLPSIVVSAHVYSSNPVQRSIVINNNFLEEGAKLKQQSTGAASLINQSGNQSA